LLVRDREMLTKKEIAKRYREAHPELIKERQCAYRKRHKNKVTESKKKWRDNNPNYGKNYYNEHKVEIVDKTHKYYIANADKIKQVTKEWRITHPLEVRNYQKEYRSINKERLSIYYVKYREENPNVIRSNNQRRRARKRDSLIENFNCLEIYERDNWMCGLCGKRVNKKLKYPNPLSASLDHIIPLAKGGKHSRANVHLAHLRCNEIAHTSGIKQTRLF
jgi:hypothetical protein